MLEHYLQQLVLIPELMESQLTLEFLGLDQFPLLTEPIPTLESNSPKSTEKQTQNPQFNVKIEVYSLQVFFLQVRIATFLSQPFFWLYELIFFLSRCFFSMVSTILLKCLDRFQLEN